MSLYEHVRHPWRDERARQGPVRVADQHPASGAFSRFNTRVGVKITSGVGTMWCAYAFCALALISLPAAIATHSAIVIVSWIAQTFFQLVLLPIIIVGQNAQGQAADKRAESTYRDAEAILHGLEQAQNHLDAQDAHLLTQDGKLADLIAQVQQIPGRQAPPPG